MPLRRCLQFPYKQPALQKYNRPMQIFMFRSLAALAVLGTALSGIPLPAQAPLIAPLSPADRAAAIDIFKQLIEINTTDTSLGNVTTGTTAMQKRFMDAGFPASDLHLL